MAPWAQHYTMDKLQALRHPNPRVRRRLFDEDHSNRDHLDNILEESRLRDRINMKEKWNFDFDNEEPLDGKYQWYKFDNETWVSVEPKLDSNASCTEIDVTLEKENQVTPRYNKIEILPEIRKRKRDDDKLNTNDKGAKRKINFD